MRCVDVMGFPHRRRNSAPGMCADRRSPARLATRRRAASAPAALVALALIASLIGAPARAGDVQTLNWLKTDAVEPAGAPAFNAALFANIEVQSSQDTPLLAGPWRGQPDLFNRFAPRFDDGQVLRSSLAGLSIHGRLMEGALDYRLTFLTGDNQILRNERGFYDGVYLRPIDASLTFNSLGLARLRLGLFRQPLGDEAASPQQRYIWPSHVAQQILQEGYFRSDNSVNGDPNFDLGPISGFRDIGLQVFDTIKTGNWEHTYALMLGRGTGVDPTLDQTGVDKYLYWSSERILGSTGKRRDGLKLYAWGQFGERELRAGPLQTEQEFNRRRLGIGATLRTGPWSLSGEWITAKGMIYHGSDGGTIPGRPSNDGTLVSGYNVLPASRADGWYLDLGYRVSEPFDLRLRYDVLNRGTDSPETEVKFQGLTIGGSYVFSPAAQLLFDVQLRRYSAPQQSGDSTTNRLLDGVDHRIGLRFIYRLGMTR